MVYYCCAFDENERWAMSEGCGGQSVSRSILWDLNIVPRVLDSFMQKCLTPVQQCYPFPVLLYVLPFLTFFFIYM